MSLDGLPTRELPGGLTIIEAATVRARLRGLGGIDGLAADRALRLPVSSIHTFTVRFLLDLIWLSADGAVIRVDRAVPRWRIRICSGARAVLEMRAGSADAFTAALRDERAAADPPPG